MKVIIVDDEPIVREGLKAIIDWNAYDFIVCDEASDGEEGYVKIMKHNPDLVIMDIKMPEMTGIELTEKLVANGYSGKIIILSGYSDFTYAQSALRLGVVSYLLKPVEEQELITIVEEVKQKIENDYISSLYSKLSSSDAKITLLSNILTKTLHIAEQNLRSYGINTDANLFQLILIEYDLCTVPFSTLLNEWKSILETQNRYVIPIEKHIVILLIGQLSIDYFHNHLLKQSEELLNNNAKPFILIGKKTTCFSDLPNQYTQYKSIMQRQFFFRTESFLLDVFGLESEIDQTKKYTFDIINTIESLFESIKSNQLYKIYETIDNLFIHLKYKELAPEQAIQIIINCILQLKILLDKTYDITLASFQATTIINNICKCEYLIQIADMLKTEITSFCKTLPESSEPTVMQKVLNYLDLHYNENIKLEQISQLFNYNPSYLGRIFHETTGEYFNAYVDKLRLEQAKELLKNSKLKNSEIAIHVGYQNTDYFYKKFKAFTGKSPNEFKKNLL